MKRNLIRMLMGMCLIWGLTGCGGGGFSPSPTATTTTATGKFIDAPVEGLKYVSGGQNGFTGANGEFTYEVGQPVTFSVGGVVIGQAPGASVITPIELVKTAAPGTTVTASSPAVVQIAQFLLTASSLTSTGIKIDTAVETACAVQNINLSTAQSSSFNVVISQIAATAGNRNVTSATDAQNHITASMEGLSSGTIVLPTLSATGGSSASVSPSLVGTWYAPYPNAGEAKGPVVITFLDGSNFMMVHDGDILADPSGQPGIERGTYTWNQTTGAFTANVVVDTNGQWGFSHPEGPVNFTVSSDGNSLLINGTALATRVTKSSSNPIIGTWYAPYPNAGEAKGPVVITFLDGSNFMMVHDGDILADPSGQPGIERGTYTWNQTTGAFTANVVVDTNGQWGFSHPEGPVNFTVSSDGNSLLINGTALATRVQ